MPNFPFINVICSDDPLLRKEAVDERLAYARHVLPNAEFHLFTTSDFQSTGGANLKRLESEMSDPGLIFDGSDGSRIIKINLSDLNDMAAEVFTTIAANFRPGVFVIVEMPRIKANYAPPKNKPLDPTPLKRYLDYSETGEGGKAFAAQQGKKTKAKKQRKGKEAKITEAFGYLIYLNADIQIIYSIDENKVKPWILDRAHRYGINLDNDALEFVANCADNNLLTIDQTLQVLGLTYPRCSLNADMIEQYFNQDSRYTGFELPIAILQKDSLKALNIINSVCTGAGSSLSDGLRLLISSMDKAINAIYTGQQTRILSRSDTEQTQFFMRFNARVFTTRIAYTKAIREWTPQMLNQATLCLSEAAQAYSNFDNEGAYRALQRLAMIPISGNRPFIKNLSTEPNLYR